MTEISNVINVPQSNNIQLTNKPKFQVGQTFSAVVVQSNKGDNEIVLKLRDGEQINAKIQGTVDLNIGGQNKFVVTGYEGGEIKISKVIVDTNENSLDNIVKQYLGNSTTPKDYAMVRSLVKYGVPLTKENILYAKTILDFQSSINKNNLKQDEFIDRYISSRGIDENSSEGNAARANLKAFISELNNTNVQDIATFIENGVDLSGENIKSFNNIFKNDSSIFNSLSDIKQEIQKLSIEQQSANINNTKINPKISAIIGLAIENNSKGGGTMSGISNVNRQGGVENKYTRKLSFDVGDVFGARVETYDGEKGEAVLKLSDGWKFNAKLDGTVNLMQNAFSKFTVEGYEDGKIIIKKLALEDTENSQNNTLNGILKEYGGENLTSDDYTMLKTLLNHSIPLTKENISFGKTVMDFRMSIIQNPENEDKFVSSYLSSKGIDGNSIEGQNMKDSIKNFFTELKGFSTDELATFIENGIDLTDANIKSFNNIFGKDATINNELNELKEQLQNVFSPKGVIEPEKFLMDNMTNIINNKNIGKDNNMSESKAIIDQINLKMNDMKDTIKQLSSLGDLSKSGMEKIVSALNNNINDFKVFNTMSEGYYYMDVPVNYKDNNYNCKLIVKDDRKRGKKIDSKNVKLATSIKTVNMGVIDAFITVSNKNLIVDIKSEGKWIKLLDSAKGILMTNTEKMGYNVNINVNEKKDEMNIVSCRNFFNNEAVGKLDKRV